MELKSGRNGWSKLAIKCKLYKRSCKFNYFWAENFHYYLGLFPAPITFSNTLYELIIPLPCSFVAWACNKVWKFELLDVAQV
jgi:hypothetical protein